MALKDGRTAVYAFCRKRDCEKSVLQKAKRPYNYFISSEPLKFVVKCSKTSRGLNSWDKTPYIGRLTKVIIINIF